MTVKLGEVYEWPSGRYMATYRHPSGFVVWTHIPEGMKPEDLGRRFNGAKVTTQEHGA